MDHAITVRDVLVTAGISVAVVSIASYALWYLAQLNGDR